jgi:hypothetical protein
MRATKQNLGHEHMGNSKRLREASSTIREYLESRYLKHLNVEMTGKKCMAQSLTSQTTMRMDLSHVATTRE